MLPRGGTSRGLTRRADFLKVSKRRELDISIVAAAFCVDLAEDGTVRKARIAYGGVAAMPTRALKAESALVGKKLTEPAIAHILHDTFTPIDDARGGAEYRRGLVVSLWEKFVSGEQSQAQDADLGYAGDSRWPVADVSRNLGHESAVGHVTGRALNREAPHEAGIWCFEDLSAHRAVSAELTPREREVAALRAEARRTEVDSDAEEESGWWSPASGRHAVHEAVVSAAATICARARSCSASPVGVGRPSRS